MGPPRTRGPRAQASRSRFHEGSMNDRVSAAPPVQFLGPEERALLERSVEAEQMQVQQQHLQQQQNQGGSIGKKGGNLLGQVWEGVRGRLRLKRDVGASVEEKKKPTTIAVTMAEKAPGDMDRPTREEALASYHQLVASGFFSSHAIQSTRQPPPGTVSQPQLPRSGAQTLAVPQHPNYAPPPPPQWPLAVTPKKSPRPSAEIRSPASASSRGTKRAADDDIEIHRDDDEDDATPKKIRKIASRDFAFPSLRNRQKLATARRISSTSNLPPVIVQQHREPNKLTKRPPPSAYSASSSSSGLSGSSSTRSSFDAPSPWSSGRRNVSDNYYSVRAVGAGSMSARVLRPRGSALEPLSVVPDVNRGIPSVPAIPAKFTFGEDRENGQPWRGLRR